MAGRKKLINRTGKDLRVTLVVRRGDHPDITAGTVDVELPAIPGGETRDDAGTKEVSYGNDVDIYLNGIEVNLISADSSVGKRQIVLERGSGLDRALNTHDTLEFLYADGTILISATNSAATSVHQMTEMKVAG